MADWLFDNPTTDTGALAVMDACQHATEDAPTVVVVREFAEATGLPCLCLDRELGRIVGQSHPDMLPFVPTDLLQRLDEQ